MNCPESLGFNLDTPQCLKEGLEFPRCQGVRWQELQLRSTTVSLFLEVQIACGVNCDRSLLQECSQSSQSQQQFDL